MSITWNGVSSDTIGVIVERMPNRYVPARRISPQSVPGRNGDILSIDRSFPNVEQEYEVYLSAESVGLPSVARACAEWLMSPAGYAELKDSYDNSVFREAVLVNGFDIENVLNQFGRCTITFSCKPQKFLYTGLPSITIDPTGDKQTYTGEIVTFEADASNRITSLTVPFSPIQSLNGYDHPWPAGGGKNKLPPASVIGEQVVGDVTFTSFADGHYHIKKTAGSTARSYAFMLAEPVDVQSGMYLVPLSAERTGNVTMGLRDASNNTIKEVYLGNPSPSAISTTATATKFYIYVAGAVDSIDADVYPMLASSVLTSFAPYSNICPISGRTGLSVYVSPTTSQADATTYAVDWTSEAGTVYGGTLDVVTGLLTVDRAKIVLDSNIPSGSSGIRNITALDNGVRFEYFPYRAIGKGDSASLWSDAFREGSVNTGEPFTCSTGASEPRMYACLPSEYNTEALIRSYFSSNPTEFVYYLATPLTYQLTPHEVETLVGENNIWADTNEEITVEVAGPSTLDNPTPFDALPLLTVSGEGAITINDRTILIQEAVEDFEIDCENGESDDNSKIYCMEFPVLHGGQNLITCDSTITSLSLIPRWWTL